MSIGDELAFEPSVTEGYRALELFTDRAAFIRKYIIQVNGNPTPRKILAFSGDGGNGKSLFLLQLQQHFSKLVDASELSRITALEDKRFVEIVQDLPPEDTFPCALYDFAAGENQGKGAFEALMSIRRKLSGSGLKFPTFDFAAIWHLYKTHRLSEEAKNLFPSEELDFVTSLVDAVSSTSYGAIAKTVVGLFFKHAREHVLLKTRSIKLDEKQLNTIQRMNPETELVENLAVFFADDLNAARRLPDAPRRISLLFDTLETFYSGAAGRNTLLWQRDERWFRLLLRSLDLDNGIIVVTAGREPPKWAELESQQHPIPANYIDHSVIGNFSFQDGRAFLARARVIDSSLQEAILEKASVRPDEVHPLYLALWVDVIRATTRAGKLVLPKDITSLAGEDLARALLRRLLLYTDEDTAIAVRALSACRSFDFNTFRLLGELLYFSATAAQFRYITSFSFIWTAGDGKYRVHSLLQKLLSEQHEQTTQKAHEALEQYYRSRSEATSLGASDESIAALTEAIYHRFQINIEEAFEEWAQSVGEALLAGQMRQCATLLSIRSEVSADDPAVRAWMSYVECEYLVLAGKPGEAQPMWENSASEDVSDELKVLGLCGKARSCSAQGKLDDAQSLLRTSLTLIETISKTRTEDAYITLIHARVLYQSAETSRLFGDLSAAERFAKASIERLESVLLQAPQTAARLQLAGAQKELGELYFEMALKDDAEKAVRACVLTCDQILGDKALASLYALAIKSTALLHLGDYAAERGDSTKALENTKQALTMARDACLVAPDFYMVHRVRASASLSLARREVTTGDSKAVAASLEEAKVACEIALRRAPRALDVVKILSDVYALEAEVVGSDPDHAIRCGEFALQEIDKLLSVFPTNLSLLLQRTEWTKQQVSRLTSAAHLDDARAVLEDAQARFAALPDAPETQTAAEWAQGSLEEKLASVHGELGDVSEARATYMKSLARYEHYLEMGGSKWRGYRDAGDVCLQLSEINRHESGIRLGEEELSKAVEFYKKGESEFPTYSSFAMWTAQALSKYGELLNNRGDDDGAIKMFEEAVIHSQLAIDVDPTSARAWNANGLALWGLGRVKAVNGEFEESISLAEQANNKFDTSLGIFDLTLARSNKAAVFAELGNTYLLQGRIEMAVACWEKAVVDARIVVQRNPTAVLMSNNLSVIEMKLGEAASAAGKWGDAERWLKAAITSSDVAIRSKTVPFIIANRVLILALLGRVASEKGDPISASVSFREALEVSDKLMEGAPELLIGQANRLTAYAMAANFETERGELQEAERILECAVAPVKKDLLDEMRGLYQLAEVYTSLGDLVFEDSTRAADAQVRYCSARECYPEVGLDVPTTFRLRLAYVESQIGRCWGRQADNHRAEAHLSLAIELLGTCKSDEAWLHVDIEEDRALAIWRRGWIKKQDGRPDAAAIDYALAQEVVEAILNEYNELITDQVRTRIQRLAESVRESASALLAPRDISA